MSAQERDRKHIMYGFIAMLILTFMCGCSGMQIQYPEEVMQEMIEEAKADNPEYNIAFNQFDRNEIKSCANIVKIKSAKFCLLNVQRGSVNGLTAVLGACLRDDFEGRLRKVNC